MYGEYILIKSYEPCQVRKEAAISSVFMQNYTFHRGAKSLKGKGVEILWHIQHYIGNLDPKHLAKW